MELTNMERILQLLEKCPRTVSDLASATERPSRLVSQSLYNLKRMDKVTRDNDGNWSLIDPDNVLEVDEEETDEEETDEEETDEEETDEGRTVEFCIGGTWVTLQIHGPTTITFTPTEEE